MATAPGSVVLRSWAELGPDEREAVRELRISDDQVEFAGTIAAAIDLAAGSDERELVGLAIVAPDEKIVGFLLLKRGAAAPEWVPEQAAAVNALRIDERRQGEGLGTAAMQAIPAWVVAAWPEVTQLVLAVDEPNTGAIAAYTNAGWIDDGARIRGRVGWERRMTLPL